MARPRIDIDVEQFKKLCALQCTEEEIASWFKCSHDTIDRFCRREFKMSFEEVFKIFSVDGKISLRRTQFAMAEHNCSMAIWLGKQYLNQKDITENEIKSDGQLSEILEFMKKDKS